MGAHIDRVEEWSRLVWDAWSFCHAEIAELLARQLGLGSAVHA